jgi:hypothetical protein
MDGRGHEQLDIHEMERRVAAALIELVDDPRERHRITPKLLAARSKLPLRQVREVRRQWTLRVIRTARRSCSGHAIGSDHAVLVAQRWPAVAFGANVSISQAKRRLDEGAVPTLRAEIG